MKQLVQDLISHITTLTTWPTSVNYSDESKNCIVISSSRFDDSEYPLSMSTQYTLNSSIVTFQIASSNYQSGADISEMIISDLECKRQTIGSTKIHYCMVMVSESLFEPSQSHHVHTIDLHFKYSQGDQNGLGN